MSIADDYEPSKGKKFDKLPELTKFRGKYPDLDITDYYEGYSDKTKKNFVKLTVKVHRSEGPDALPPNTEACVIISQNPNPKYKRYAAMDLARVCSALANKPFAEVTKENVAQLAKLNFKATPAKLAAEVVPDSNPQYSKVQWTPYTR